MFPKIIVLVDQVNTDGLHIKIKAHSAAELSYKQIIGKLLGPILLVMPQVNIASMT